MNILTIIISKSTSTNSNKNNNKVIIVLTIILIAIIKRLVLCVRKHHRARGYGATVARLTPDQKVGSSNLSALSTCIDGGMLLCEVR